MKWVWVDAGNDPQYEKLAANGIKGCFFALSDPRVTKPYLQAVAARGFAAGVYMAWNWPQYAGKTGKEMAELVNDQVAPLIVSDRLPKVQFDIEEHDPSLIGSCLLRWRQLRRSQDTSWTLEGMQGGWMDKAFVTVVLGTKVRVAPQSFTGDMRPQAQDAVLRDLTRRGFPESIVSLFYDAAHLPIDWSGWAFTQGRLPPL